MVHKLTLAAVTAAILSLSGAVVALANGWPSLPLP
jgi:hypothetical protein